MELMSEGENLRDPLLCPTFDLGGLDDTDESLERETVDKTDDNSNKSNQVLCNVAVLASSGMVEELSGNITGGGEDPPGGEATLTSRADRESPPTPESAPQGPLRKPTRHPNAIQKIRMWSFEVTDPVVILGDSNLSRVPAHGYPSVQVESFPGAQIHHLKGIIAKLDANTATQKVVLSVGLNNCLRENLLDTITKQFQQLVALARRTFPNAQIYVPLIQCSDKLKPKQQQLAQQTNIFLQKHFITLQMVEENAFAVNDWDPVHWTAKTATEIFKNWMSQLN